VPSVSFFDLAGVIYILVLWDLLKSAVLIGSLILKPSISRLRVFFLSYSASLVGSLSCMKDVR
jgi:hypothetical protein